MSETRDRVGWCMTCPKRGLNCLSSETSGFLPETSKWCSLCHGFFLAMAVMEVGAGTKSSTLW